MKYNLTEEQKDNWRKAIQALRDNPRKATNKMRDELGGRCCLCVMKDVAEDGDGVDRGDYIEDGYFPSKIYLENFYGLESCAEGYFNIRIEGQTLSDLNDGAKNCEEKSHAEIADMLEREIFGGES